MYTKKQHIVRKTIIVSLSFILGFASAVFAAATYDANVQSRAAAMMKTIKSNASTLAPVDQTAYYTLVRLNIESLIQVLMSVNSSLDVEIGSISELNDANILNQITNVSTTGSSTLANTSTASTSTFTVTVNSGILYCGDPTRNDYTTYSPVDKKVIIQKSYCNEKGGKIWIKCNGENTNIKTVDSFQGGEILTCPTTSVQTPGTATSVSAGVSTSTNSCKWQYHPVFWPVGAMTIDPSATNCTPNTNGTKAVEVSGNRQTVATCTCPTATTTTNTSTTTTTQNTPSCAGTAPTGEGIIKSTSVFGMVGSDTWSYVANSKWTSTDLGMSCQWTCAPGYTRLENKCTSGSSTVSLSITPATGVFSMVDKNTLTPVVTGLTKENTLICNEVLAHPAYPSAVSPAGYCSNPANFVPFSGNEDWTYTNGKWVGNVKYNASIYGAAWIKARGFWKNKATGTVVTYDLSVIAGSSSTASVGAANQNYRWSCIVPGPAVVDTSNFSCNSSNVWKSQTIGGYSCNCTGPAVTPGTVSSLNQVTLTVPSGMVACGNPDKNDYTTYGTVGGKVILQKEYCISKGWYAWVVCDGKATNIKNVDTIKDGETFTCPTTNTTTSTNSCKWQYHPVFWPVGAMTIDPSATNCTPNTNGTKAVEVSGNRQTVATCTCPTATTTTNTSTTTTTQNTPSCAGTAPTGEGIIKSTSVFGMVGSDTWSYVANSKWTSTDLGMSCQWTCAPGYTRLENKCIIRSAPRTVWTDANFSIKNQFSHWQSLYGYIEGGDSTNTWACLDIPTPTNECDSPSKFRKLTVAVDGIADGWQINPSNGRIELRWWLYLDPAFPEWVYTGYARTWQYGSDTTIMELRLMK